MTDRRTRAELLDEGLDIVTGLWRGQPFNYDGKHYTVRETTFSPPAPPVQQPRIPIWVVGAWRREKSMRRALRYDGLLPNIIDPQSGARDAHVEEFAAMRDYVAANRTEGGPYDIVAEGETPGDDAAAASAILRPWQVAGATWWLESRWQLPRETDTLTIVRERIAQGPPRLDE